LNPTHITCQSATFDNGSIDLSVTGGATPYTFIWSNSATSEDLLNLTPGLYRVTVTDRNACTKMDSVMINLPPALTIDTLLSDYFGKNISCYGLADGSIRVTPLTGKSPYIYTWTTTGGSGLIPGAATQTGLTTGQYTVVVTDANLCTATGIFNLTQPGRLSMILTPSSSSFGGYNINCAGASTGSIDVDPVNNGGAVTYLWSDGATGKLRTNIGAGTYTVIITDQNNCQTDSTYTLTDPDSIRTSFTVKQAFCPDSPDGEILLTVTGGFILTDYSYVWSDGSTSQNLSNVLRGKYIVKVTDANSCSVKDSVVIEPLNETCLIIPNAISPDDDNINDVWNIGRIELYPQLEVKVFNRWGELLWKSEKGYPHPWDGRSNGKPLPIDSYHFTIDLHNGTKPVVGNITIVR
jgi:gliding motility-associated-like protein